MSRRVRPDHAIVVACALSMLVACGKRGDPLPPLRPVPARIADLSARRTADRVELTLTVPAANADGTTPPAVDRVDVFATSLPADAPVPTAAQVAGNTDNLIGRVLVRAAAADDPPPSAAAGPNAAATPGAAARVVDVVGPDGAGAVRYYAAVGIAGTGSGRPGPASAVLPVPLGPPPSPPVSVSLTHDAAEVVLSWQPAAPDQRFLVFRTGAAFDPETATLLTPEPTPEASHRVPVEFGREACFTIVSLTGAPPVTVEGAPSPVQCLTPTDTYPPPAPSGVQALVGSDAVTLVWTAVPADDLAGYVVLRGTAGGGNLEPLFREPSRATSYRDTSVQPGETYTYAVYAVDRAPVPNVSEMSAPQVVTIR